jgi:hypothetical protein
LDVDAPYLGHELTDIPSRSDEEVLAKIDNPSVHLSRRKAAAAPQSGKPWRKYRISAIAEHVHFNYEGFDFVSNMWELYEQRVHLRAECLAIQRKSKWIPSLQIERHSTRTVCLRLIMSDADLAGP